MAANMWGAELNDEQHQQLEQIKDEKGMNKSQTLRHVINQWQQHQSQSSDDGGDDWPAMVTEQVVGTSAVAAIVIGLATLLGWVPQFGGLIVGVVLLSMAVIGTYALQGDLV